MAFLFDTDAISHIFRARPFPGYLHWLKGVSRTEQFTSAVTIGELFKGAYRTDRRDHFLTLIEERVLPSFTVLAYDTEVARTYGRLRAELESSRITVAEADLMIGATARRYGLKVVTGNIKHFSKIPGIELERALADSRS